jgi:glycosyltransferase involved in cell wall biosynthesis
MGHDERGVRADLVARNRKRRGANVSDQPMTSSTAFSVIIPTLARPRLLPCLASVLDQTYAPDEIIVADNGSLDSASADEICREIDDGRVKFISLPPHSGPSLPRNLGAWHASSTYLAFLDDDDEWAPDYLERIADVIKRTSADMVFATRVEVGADGSKIQAKKAGQHPTHDWLKILLNGYNPGVGGQNLVMRRDRFFALGGFPLEYSSGGDRALTVAALRAGVRLEVADDAVVYLREPGGWRVTGHRRNSINDIRLLVQNWKIMNWDARIRHAHAVYKRRRNHSRRGALPRGEPLMRVSKDAGTADSAPGSAGRAHRTPTLGQPQRRSVLRHDVDEASAE